MAISQKPISLERIAPPRQSDEVPAVLTGLAAQAGVRFNGNDPWDIQVHDSDFYRRVLAQGSLGLGEAYMDGLWSCQALDQLIDHLLTADLDEKFKRYHRLKLLAAVLKSSLFNLQSPLRAYQVGEQHYDIGNDVFIAMLDSGLNYSCGYWRDATTLEQAQLAKLDLICRKLELQQGEKLLDIGCGWGGLAQYASSHYGVEVTGITISREQQRLAEDRCAGLPVRIELMDYRDLRDRYDKVVSVGMFEHVGRKNYATYFDTVLARMKDTGLFLLHTIGNYRTEMSIDRWIDKYIFPNSMLPSARDLADNLEGRFLIEDWHNFGLDYDRTLMAWWQNFDRAWSTLGKRYSERFYRMWQYYLLSCAGLFRSRQGQLWQLVLSKRSRRQRYQSLR